MLIRSAAPIERRGVPRPRAGSTVTRHAGRRAYRPVPPSAIVIARRPRPRGRRGHHGQHHTHLFRRHRPRHHQQRDRVRQDRRRNGQRWNCCPSPSSSRPPPSSRGTCCRRSSTSAPDADREANALDVPWAKGKDKHRDYAVGELARKQSADVPTRTVVGAKSWLAYSKVDRRQPILPWGAPDDVPKVSPVEATRRYLEHVVAAWSAAHPDAPLKHQHVVLTVPGQLRRRRPAT